MPVRAIFLLLVHLIDLLQWVKNNTNRCHRSLVGVEFDVPFFVLQQQQCCCNRKEGFSLTLRSYVHIACPMCLYQLNSWCGWACKDGDNSWNKSLHNTEWRSSCYVWKSPNSLELTCWKLSACNVCSFTFLLKKYGGIFQCYPCFEAQKWPWLSLLGANGGGSMLIFLHICFLSLAEEAASKDAGCDRGFWSIGTCPFQSLWMDGNPFMEGRYCMWRITLKGWIGTKPLRRGCCSSWLLPSTSQVNAFLDEIALNFPCCFKVYS